jgi:hypothetical protein
MQRADSREIELGFYLLGDIPEAMQLERLFGVTSSVSYRKGAPRIRRNTGERTGTHSESIWGFNTSSIASNEMNDHAEWILTKVSPAAEFLASFPNARAFIEIILEAGNSAVLPSRLIQFACDTDTEIGIVARSVYA